VQCSERRRDENEGKQKAEKVTWVWVKGADEVWALYVCTYICTYKFAEESNGRLTTEQTRAMFI
jgi:hypothetical protein